MKSDLCLRKVNKDDIMITFHWANDIELRKNSFKGNFISLSNHIEWINNKINNCEHYYIMEKNNEAIGQIRLDIVDEEFIINYSIDCKFRGKGYGKRIILLIEEKLLEKHSRFKLIAKVKETNIASINIFRSLNYKEVFEDEMYKFYKEVCSNGSSGENR